jgi:hypothetical protein
MLVLILLFLHNHPLPIQGPFVRFLDTYANFAAWPQYITAGTLLAIVGERPFIEFMQNLLFAHQNPPPALPSPVIVDLYNEAAIETREARFNVTVRLLQHAVGFTEVFYLPF